MVTANDVIKVAQEWLGYPEKDNASNLESFNAAGHKNYTIFAKILDAIGNFYNGPKQGFAWCDVFVDCCVYIATGKNLEDTLYILCQPRKSAGAGCLYSAQYYKQAGRWSTKPQIGAQIFFSYAPNEVSHTGLVESYTASTVTTIEGNSSDKVMRRVYNINDSSIYGYGLPRYGESSNVVPTPQVNPQPQPQPTKKTYYTIKLPEVNYGDSGYIVKGLQALLIERGFKCGAYGADGDFGTGTLNAVKNFQSKNGLTVDGSVGGDTWAKLLGGQKL